MTKLEKRQGIYSPRKIYLKNKKFCFLLRALKKLDSDKNAVMCLGNLVIQFPREKAIIILEKGVDYNMMFIFYNKIISFFYFFI